MKKIITKIIISAAILAAAGTAIWWYEIRPAMIRNDCNWIAWEELDRISKLDITIPDAIDFYELKFKACLRNKGLDK